MAKPVQWTNRSVLALSEGKDPVDVVTARARAIAMEAMDNGWTGPPFDPLGLATFLKIDVLARDDVRDARTIASEKGTPVIEYNPTRPRGRVRYSLAHEIAHTLFDDWSEQVRNRAQRDELKGDDWQLEALCNIAAAEFVIPIGSFAKLAETQLDIDSLINEQKRYDVSMEALLIRAVHLRTECCAMFCASPIMKGSTRRYRIDYLIGSHGWKTGALLRGQLLQERTIVAKCSAIGFTAKGQEEWAGREQWRVEAVGIPPYPGSPSPRVVGLLLPIEETQEKPPRLIEFVFGDATRPQGGGPRVIAQIVTDEAVIWGGGGFAAAVRRAWPHAQEEFRQWVAGHREHLGLGRVHVSSPRDQMQIASIVAQHGYGQASRPRVRYNALRQGLSAVAQLAREIGATVHMPRIGTGLAGGSWDIVEELIWDTLGRAGVHVTVYDLPGRRSIGQPSLFSMLEERHRGQP
jgi:O-acetyl-ADP-ribose deacetylase (regulator of RNase III)